MHARLMRNHSDTFLLLTQSSQKGILANCLAYISYITTVTT